MNLFLIFYYIFLLAFVLGSAAILYHLIKFQLSRASMFVTVVVFMVGAGLLLLVNLIIASQVQWDNYIINFGL